MDYNLYKIGGILLANRKLLVCRSKGKDFFVAPGGKVEKGETAFEALKRELKEEVNIIVGETALESFGTFYAPAAGDEKNILRMDVFLVKSYDGRLSPGAEVEEITWVSSKIPNTIKVGSIFEHHVIPKLKELRMID